MSKNKINKIVTKNLKNDMKSWDIDVEYMDEATGEMDMLNFTVFAKNLTKAEKKIKKLCGKWYIGIWDARLNGGIPVC